MNAPSVQFHTLVCFRTTQRENALKPRNLRKTAKTRKTTKSYSKPRFAAKDDKQYSRAKPWKFVREKITDGEFRINCDNAVCVTMRLRLSIDIRIIEINLVSFQTIVVVA